MHIIETFIGINQETRSIPTGMGLSRGVTAVETLCGVCGVAHEVRTHTLYLCRMLKGVWEFSEIECFVPRGCSWIVDYGTSVSREWMRMKFFDEIFLFLTICWAIRGVQESEVHAWLCEEDLCGGAGRLLCEFEGEGVVGLCTRKCGSLLKRDEWRWTHMTKAQRCKLSIGLTSWTLVLMMTKEQDAN